MRAVDANLSTARAARGASSTLFGLFIAVAFSGQVAPAANPDPAMEARIAAFVPRFESYVAEGMTAFDCPGLVTGIVAGDKLVYAKGFGVLKKGGEPVDAGSLDSRSAPRH
jgi:CubicO group peptidase (beta-lactamase class C family)